jgi:hypothetical protein
LEPNSNCTVVFIIPLTFHPLETIVLLAEPTNLNTPLLVLDVIG